MLLDPRMADDFWSRVQPEPNSGCWLWTGSVNGGGYANYGYGTYGHIRSFVALVGPVPEGRELDHKCRTRCCVNPAHLEAVTHAENVKRGHAGAHERAKTHCRRGHAYAGSNLIQRGDGARRCRACESILRSSRALARKVS